MARLDGFKTFERWLPRAIFGSEGYSVRRVKFSHFSDFGLSVSFRAIQKLKYQERELEQR